MVSIGPCLQAQDKVLAIFRFNFTIISFIPYPADFKYLSAMGFWGLALAVEMLGQ
jgi:hypothetical protein